MEPLNHQTMEPSNQKSQIAQEYGLLPADARQQKATKSGGTCGGHGGRSEDEIWKRAFKDCHPRRPRAGRSGREKRRDESFQAQAVKPLGKANAGSRLGTKIALYYCAQSRRTVSPEFFSWVRTRRLLSRHTCPVRSPSLCVQGKLLFSTFLTRNKGITDELKKRLGYYQQEQLNLPREYSVFDGSQLRCGGDEKFK